MKNNHNKNRRAGKNERKKILHLFMLEEITAIKLSEKNHEDRKQDKCAVTHCKFLCVGSCEKRSCNQFNDKIKMYLDVHPHYLRHTKMYHLCLKNSLQQVYGASSARVSMSVV